MRYEEPHMEYKEREMYDVICTSNGGLKDNITDPDDDGIDLTFG